LGVASTLRRRARLFKRQTRGQLWSLSRHGRILTQPFRGEFAAALDDPGIALCADLRGDSHTLLIAFGGIRGQLAVPPFEFFRATRGIPVKRLFVRDLRQAWYHLGVPGYGTSVEGLAEALRDLLARHDVDRLVVTGNSMGGYAALVFGTLLGANTVLAFGPQTVLDPDALLAMQDHRWEDLLGELRAAGALDAHWTDLRRALPGQRRGRIRYELYFDDSLRPERLHAERLLGIEGVRLYRFGRGGHEVARSLREAGALDVILRRALDAGHLRPAEALAASLG
jgi:pimeloyl-ACP methyl ester carboxylesterase